MTALSVGALYRIKGDDVLPFHLHHHIFLSPFTGECDYPCMDVYQYNITIQLDSTRYAISSRVVRMDGVQCSSMRIVCIITVYVNDTRMGM